MYVRVYAGIVFLTSVRTESIQTAMAIQAGRQADRYAPQTSDHPKTQRRSRHCPQSVRLPSNTQPDSCTPPHGTTASNGLTQADKQMNNRQTDRQSNKAGRKADSNFIDHCR
mmetsp:Transcript_34664/g.85954  ORF Transcript_34664/g.85954 Transcript_34664/m.85954 type:complete len:112 (-) Transcript_34664:130-465(-)